MTAPPGNLADRPATPADLLRPPREFADPPALEDAVLDLDADDQPHDLLSELLRSVRLNGERIVAYAPPRTFSISFADIGSLHIIEVARRMLVFEMQSPSQGSAVMVARILDLLFIQILRAWAAGTHAEPNWLAGALDPQIGLALSAIHRNPGHDWTVEELARACSLQASLRHTTGSLATRRTSETLVSAG